MSGKKDQRKATTLRMSTGEARLVEKLQKLRGERTDQSVIHAVFVQGLRSELLVEGVRRYRQGATLEEAAREVGLPYGKLFDHCVTEGVTLIQDPNFLEHTAALGRALGLPALSQAAERVLSENRQPA